MMGLTNRFKCRLAGFLLLILSAYYVNSTMSYHQHVICGETVFHSHLSSSSHAESPESDGGHTLEVAKLIALLSQISLEEQDLFGELPSVDRVLVATLEISDVSTDLTTVASQPSLRAPPFCI